MLISAIKALSLSFKKHLLDVTALFLDLGKKIMSHVCHAHQNHLEKHKKYDEILFFQHELGREHAMV